MGDANPCFKAEHGAWKLANAGTPKVQGFDEALRSAQAATTCGLPGRARAHVLGPTPEVAGRELLAVHPNPWSSPQDQGCQNCLVRNPDRRDVLEQLTLGARSWRLSVDPLLQCAPASCLLLAQYEVSSRGASCRLTAFWKVSMQPLLVHRDAHRTRSHG